LREARWLPDARQPHALTHEPTECLGRTNDPRTAKRIEIGRAAFRTPLLLGGQAARAGLACSSCHRNGRGNPDFHFPGVSGAPGTADVTSSLLSSQRGDGLANPVPIPDLSGPVHAISRAAADPALATFIRGLIVEEFDGPEPSALTLDSLVHYVRALSPQACPPEPERRIRVAHYLDDARRAARAAQLALDAHDPATARLMLAGARHALGLIDERYVDPATAIARHRLRNSDSELAAIQQAIDAESTDTTLRITAWLATITHWAELLRRDEAVSLFDVRRLQTALAAEHEPALEVEPMH
jgi:hypothetical protein